MSKGYQSYGRCRKDLAFGGRLACLLALTHGRVLGAGFRMSIPFLFGFNYWPCARYAGYRVRYLAMHDLTVGCWFNEEVIGGSMSIRFVSYGRSRFRRDGMQAA
jgi:hypothetical protein